MRAAPVKLARISRYVSRSIRRRAISSSWDAFSSAAAGEYEGCTSTYVVSGPFRQSRDSPSPPSALPAKYVPDAFRDWDRTLYDWQTQASTLVSAGGTQAVSTRVKRLFPIVGCEADAVAFVEEPEAGAPGSIALAWSPDGSYARAPASLGTSSTSSGRIEACFALPAGEDLGGVALGGTNRRRVRIVHDLSLLKSGDGRFSIDVHLETWEGPFVNGASLRSCGASIASFAEKAPLSSDVELGRSRWAAVPNGVELGTTGEGFSLFTRLPLNAWSGLCISEAGSLLIESGLILGGGQSRLVSRQVYHPASPARPYHMHDFKFEGQFLGTELKIEF